MNTLEILTALKVAGIGLRQAQHSLKEAAKSTRSVHAMASRAALQAADDLDWRIEQIKDVHTGIELDGLMTDTIRAIGLNRG